MKHRALVLKVSDYSLVRVFPFEKTYFFHNSAKAQVGKIFRFGLVAHITKPLQDMLANVMRGSVNDKPSGVGASYPIKRFDEQMEKELISLKPMKDILANPKDYFMVVPILVKASTINLQRTFSYLYPRRAPRHRYRNLNRVLGGSGTRHSSTSSYAKLFKSVHVIFDNQEIRTPCIFCRKAIAGMAGHCLFGSFDCATGISFAGHGQFVENLRKYKEIMTNFPDRLKGADHGSVSSNDS